ncbi:MAG: tetratricopeptide repeat protein [Methanobacterium sp.]
MEINPNNRKAWYNKGKVFMDLGRYEEAIKAYDNALRVSPKDIASWYNKGVSLEKLDKVKDAIEAYNTALKLDPEFKPALKDKEELLKN